MQAVPECMLELDNIRLPGSLAFAARLALPSESSLAPVLPVLPQPTPAPFGLPHAQALTPPAPGTQNATPGGAAQMFVMLVAVAEPASCARPNMSSIVRSTDSWSIVCPYWPGTTSRP